MRVVGTTDERAERYRIGAYALVAFVLTPFAVTAIYRALPDDWPAWGLTPFLVLGLTAVAIWLWRPRWRAIAGSMTASLVIYFAFLFWLTATFFALD